jgi:hypothetical protein
METDLLATKSEENSKGVKLYKTLPDLFIFTYTIFNNLKRIDDIMAGFSLFCKSINSQ